MAIHLDASGNIYIAGTAYDASHNQYDFLIVKYQNNGTLSWFTTRDGISFNDDYATALITDAYQNVYVTGASESSSTGMDFMTLKLFPTGSVHWVKRYNHYVNLDDAPVSIQFLDATTLEVTGGSQSSSTAWDVASARYKTNGITGPVYRHSSYNMDFERPMDLAKDASGNFYVAGSADMGATGYDLKILKLSPTLSLQWQKTIDGNDLDDSANSISVDINGNVYVSGYAVNASGGKEYCTLKLNSSGTEQWMKSRQAESPTKDAIAEEVCADTSGNVYVTGEIAKGDGSEIVTVKYDDDGEFLWERSIAGDVDAISKPFNLLLDQSGKTFLTGITTENGKVKYTTVKYEEYDRDVQVVLDSSGVPSHVLDEIIIRFSTSVINQDFVDNRKLTFGSLCDVIIDTTLIGLIEDKLALAPSDDVCDCKLIKMHPMLTSEPICATDVFGDPVYVPPFWTKFILKDCNSSVKDEKELSAKLDSISIDYIAYAHTNKVGQSASTCSDSLCGDQHSLWDAPDPLDGSYDTSATINILPAWDITTGSSEVGVGLFDTGLFIGHEDFDFGAVIPEAWDFFLGDGVNLVPLTQDVSPGHGTRSAGLIGALRNNDIGIAGIAGGDDSLGIAGTSIYGFRIAESLIAFLESAYERAIVYAALNGENGPLIDVASNSWQYIPNTTSDENAFNETTEFVFTTGITIVSSRGNDIDGNNLEEVKFPAGTVDEYGISVGASGTDGELKTNLNGQNFGGLDDSYWSNYGSGMDLIAPGSAGLIRSTTTHVQGGYGAHNGTSASAPHVAGVAALLLAKSETRLSPEDIERVLEYSSTDLDSTGYDNKTGWGRLNAGKALDLLNNYQIAHFNIPLSIDTLCDYTIADAVCGMELTQDYMIDSMGLGAGVTYSNIKVFRYHANINLDVRDATGDNSARIYSPSTTKPGYWILNSRSNLWGVPIATDTIPPEIGYYE